MERVVEKEVVREVEVEKVVIKEVEVFVEVRHPEHPEPCTLHPAPCTLHPAP